MSSYSAPDLCHGLATIDNSSATLISAAPAERRLDGDRMPDELYQLCIDSVWDGADESKDEIARGLRDRGVQL